MGRKVILPGISYFGFAGSDYEYDSWGARVLDVLDVPCKVILSTSGDIV